MHRAAVLLLMLAVPAAALPDGDRTVKDEKLNFEISIPEDSIDWKIETIDEARKKQGEAALLSTTFADSSPVASCQVRVMVIPLARTIARMPLAKIQDKWKEHFESHLSNPRDRKETAGKFGEVEYSKVDVKGDYESGIHQRTWFVSKNGQYLYIIYIDRNYQAVGDELLEEEVQSILGSFKFLRVEKVKADKKAKGKGPGDVGGPAQKAKKIDPELIKIERFKEPFWRFHCTKPEGLLVRKLTDAEKKLGIKYFFERDKNQSRLWIRVYAQTDKAKKWTIEQLKDHKLGYWKKEVKVTKDPKIDTKYAKKFPMAKKAIRVDLTGRQNVTIKRTWILANCKNDRQYQIEIYLTGTQGTKVFGKTIEKFLKDFKPVKGG
jgi:hypothetical protein